MTSGTPVSLIGLPYQFGRRADDHGYQMARGPEILLAPGAVPTAVGAWTDNVTLTWLDNLDEPVTEPGATPLSPGDQMTRQLHQNNGLARAVAEAKGMGRFPVICAGGCNSSLGVVAGLSDPELGMFWFDAHADAETPDTSDSGLFEGMPVSIIAGLSWPRYRERIKGFQVIPESRIVQVGLHDNAFVPEFAPPQGLGTLVDPPAVAQHGFEQAFLNALEVMCQRARRVYVHIDTDVLDPAYVRGNLHTAPGGPTPDQLRWAVSEIAGRLSIQAVNFTSYDTAVDEHAPSVLVPLASDIAHIAASRTAAANT